MFCVFADGLLGIHAGYFSDARFLTSAGYVPKKELKQIGEYKE